MPIPFFLLAAVLTVADQVVKYLVRLNIPLGQRLSFLPGVMDLTFVQNTGAAFSLLEEHTWLLTLLSGAAAVVLAVLLVKKIFSHWSGQLALGLLLGGAVGNFIDRLLLGYVTDMFAVTFVNFPVFNVADIGVVVGGVLLCVHVILFMKDGDKKEGGACS
ncbi:MAG: signal peptidase II [Bacillota bacterium]|nr:signal peptidase II [Bacillota bacterium]